MDLIKLIDSFESYEFTGYNIMQILNDSGYKVKIMDYNDLINVTDLDHCLKTLML